MERISEFLVKHKVIFYVLQFTWGIVMNIIGMLAYLFLITKKSIHIRHCIETTVGTGWGGVSLGMFTFVCSNMNYTGHLHETGHSYQNAIFGPLFLFIVAIPSAVRYWYQRLFKPTNFDYEAAWFERQATNLGVHLSNF